MSAPSIALVGVGPWGRNHLRVLDALGQLRWAHDRDPVALERAPAHRRASELEKVLDDPGVRAVVLATPARTHYALARRALDAGKDVLVEKPLTLDEAEGRELAERAAASGRVLMVGHVTLFHPAVVRLKEFLQEEALGRVRYLYSHRLNLGTVREEEDILWSFAPHDFAVFLHLLQAWPDAVQVVGGGYLRPDRADVTVTHLEFPGPVRAHSFVSWLHPFKEHRLVVVGDRRMAAFTDGPEGGELRIWEHPWERLQDRPPPPRGPGLVVPLERIEPLRAELQHFLQCLETRAEPRSGAAHGLDVLRLLSVARDSLADGGLPKPCPRVREAAR